MRWFFAVFVTFSSATAGAQIGDTTFGRSDGRHEVSIQLGAFKPTARFGLTGVTGDKGERFGSTGFLFSADYFRAVTPAVAVGLEGLYLNRGNYFVKNLAFANSFAGATSRVRGDTKAVLATFRFRRPGTGYRPYVIGGVGGHVTTLDVYMQAPPGFFWGAGFGEEITVVRGNASGLIWTVRGGIEKAWADGGTLGIEVGFIGIPSHRYDRTAFGRAIGLPSDVVSAGDGFSLAAKFGYRFGRRP